MGRTKVKICGITTPEDAAMCLDAGADYLGVIFAESARQIGVDKARQIRAAVPGGRLVGVFADADLDFARDTASRSGLDLIQVHGAESPQYVESLHRRTGLPVIKAVTRGESSKPGAIASYEAASFFLFDLEKKSLNKGAGGAVESGVQNSMGDSKKKPRLGRQNGEIHQLWDEADRFVRRGYRIFLAGGLTPSNVGYVLRRTRPFCVDVCRGVERLPGRKSYDGVERFIAEVRR